LLAAIAIWSVVAYAVGQRRRELSVRIALGSSAAGVVGLVLRQGALAAAAGLALGVPAAWATSRLLTSLLFSTRATDVAIYAAAAAALGGVALLACCLPALRAARVDPMHAMRSE
jgi:ABC-type antimicrobial peptide transport system permease subunit